MNKKRLFAVIKDCFTRHTGIMLLLGIVFSLNLAVFLLYRLDMKPFFYAGLLMLAALICFMVVDCAIDIKRAAERDHILDDTASQWRSLPQPEKLEEADYQRMIRTLGSQAEKMALQFDSDRQDMLDYYTAWVHQIKTPISVMHMLLAEEDTGQSRALKAELFRIEQYVDMALQYIRLGSQTNDLVIRDYPLDSLLRASIRKFAPQFIARKLRLIYEPSDFTLVTDAKWFSVIIDQLLSNAIKYTPSGSVTLRVTEDHHLIIADTGIGIAPEDLPRVFEKGYTGLNGRLEQKSSGLGLYLCKQAANKLSLPLSAKSVVGKGSEFIIDLNQK